MAINALKKITAKSVLKTIPKEEKLVPQFDEAGAPLLDSKDQPILAKKMVAVEQDLFVVAFKVHGHKSGSTQFGDYVEYIGTVQARRLSDGEIFQSTRYIPSPLADDLLWDMYSAAKQEDESAIVEGIFAVGVAPSNRGKDGYAWTVKPLLTEQEEKAVTDPFAALFDRANKAGITVPGLAAPEGQAALTDGTKKK